MTLEEFFSIADSLVPDERGCLIWTGETTNGYPIRGRNRAQRGNRIILERKLERKLLSGMHALHPCDNKLCLNANHLYEGTHQQNMDDMVNRGRSPRGLKNGKYTKPECTPRGEDHWAHRNPEIYHRGNSHWTRRLGVKTIGSKNSKAKLTEKDIPIIRELIKTERQCDIARKYGVSRYIIGRITSGLRWSHV